MKDTTKGATLASHEEDEATEGLDDSTRQVLDDYSRRLLGFIQQEKEKVRKQTHEESEKVLVDAHKKGQLVYEQIVNDAGTEAEHILAYSREQAAKLTEQVERLLQATVDLREKTQKDVEDIRGRLQLEAASLAELMRRTDKAIADSKAKLAKEFEASLASLTQLIQTLKPSPLPRQGSERMATVAPKEQRESEDFLQSSATRNEDYAKKHGDKTFTGTINIDVEKVSPALLRRFREALAKVQGLEISATEDYSKDRAKIVAFASRPIILMNILNQMALVKSATAEKGSVQVILQDADRWVG